METKIKDEVIYGDPDTWELIFKISRTRQGWEESTKRMKLPNGYIYQVETRQRNPDGSYSIAKAITFEPVTFAPDK